MPAALAQTLLPTRPGVRRLEEATAAAARARGGGREILQPATNGRGLLQTLHVLFTAAGGVRSSRAMKAARGWRQHWRPFAEIRDTLAPGDPLICYEVSISCTVHARRCRGEKSLYARSRKHTAGDVPAFHVEH